MNFVLALPPVSSVCNIHVIILKTTGERERPSCDRAHTFRVVYGGGMRKRGDDGKDWPLETGEAEETKES